MRIELAPRAQTDLQVVQPGANVAINAAYNAAKIDNPNAISLGIGVVGDDSDNLDYDVMVPPIVRVIWARDFGKLKGTGYRSVRGCKQYLDQQARNLIFGEELFKELEHGLASIETNGGTEAVSFAFQILRMLYPEVRDVFYDSGWGNTPAIMNKAGHGAFNLTTYTHEDVDSHTYNHELCCEGLRSANPGSIAHLQVCAHNSDGRDRSTQQWYDIIEIILEKELIPVMDAAYLGLAEGLIQDSYVLRELAKKGVRTFICTSNSKNAGLYDERLGALYVVNCEEVELEVIQTNLEAKIARPGRSFPGSRAGRVMGKVLSTPSLLSGFRSGVEAIQSKLITNRAVIADAMGELASGMSTGSGLFAQVQGLNAAAIQALREDSNMPIFALPPGADGRVRVNVGSVPAKYAAEVGQRLREAIECG